MRSTSKHHLRAMHYNRSPRLPLVAARLLPLILAALLAAQPALACPPGYVPCGSGGALCCR